uniref:MBD domain-containing protein n=1 Tax=Caenorhabditis tropicalis TaxID=1561998 RepID=A0A1I7TU12_9PELO
MSAITNEKVIFQFNLTAMDGKSATESRQIRLEPFQSVVIQSLHSHLKSLQKELEEEKNESEKTNRKIEEKDAELFELNEINRMNFEKSIQLKEEVQKAEEDVQQLRKKLEEAKIAIEALAKDAESKKEEESIETILKSYGPAWSTGEDVVQRPRYSNPLTVFGWQPPSKPLPQLPIELPLSAGDGKRYCFIKTAGREGHYRRTMGVYKLIDDGFKQRPVNYYAQPTAILN